MVAYAEKMLLIIIIGFGIEFIAKTRAIKIMNNDLKRENINILNQQASDLVITFEG